MTDQHELVETGGVDVVADGGRTQSERDGAEGRRV
jgi:hypothetical protein